MSYFARIGDLICGNCNNFLIYSQIRKEIRKNPNLCKSDYDMIQDWNMNKTKTACGLVWHQGWDDLHQMAQTYKDKYPNLFNGPYSPKTYSFIHSSAHRTKQSCEAFVDELFGEKVMEDSQKNWKTDDMLLRVSLYDICCSILIHIKINSHGAFALNLANMYILLTMKSHKWKCLWIRNVIKILEKKFRKDLA